METRRADVEGANDSAATAGGSGNTSRVSAVRGYLRHRSHPTGESLARNIERRSDPQGHDAAEPTRTQIHYAALDDDTDALAVLLPTGVDPTSADEQGATPLHCAAHVGALGALTMLLATGVDPDPADGNGNTPLIIAVTAGEGDTRLVAALLEAGADPYWQNHFDRTAADMALLLGHADQAALFADIAPSEANRDRRRRVRRVS